MAARYDVVGLGVATLDLIGVAASEPLLGAKQPLAQWVEAGGQVMIDAERYSDVAARLLPLCDYMVMSERFARAATGDDDLPRAAQALQRQHGGVAVVTPARAAAGAPRAARRSTRQPSA